MADELSIPQSLKDFFIENPRPALAFSGGVDSTYLMYVCRKLEIDMAPIFVLNGFQTTREFVNARNLCNRYYYDIKTAEIDSLSDANIAANGPDRCYLCKKRIFTLVTKWAKSQDRYVIDGTNASDNPDDRPGMKALEELGVRSPLRECGITKPQVREYSRLAGIPNWDMPSDSCLATRVQTGMKLSYRTLEKVEKAEMQLRLLGFNYIRVRVTPEGARFESLPSQKDLLEESKDEVEEILLKYFDSVSYGERKPGL